MEKPWEQLHKGEDSELIGKGSEKKVYRSQAHPERVFGEYNIEAESVNAAKARFYLTKIVHILLPKNVPDIYLSSSKSNATVREKVHLDELDRRIQTISRNEHVSQDEAAERMSLRREAKTRRGRAADELDFEEAVAKLGIRIDNFSDNFAYDTEGKFQYFEDFKAISRGSKGNLYRWFDEMKLHEAIQQISNEKLREKAERYFKRLLELVTAEEKKAQNE